MPHFQRCACFRAAAHRPCPPRSRAGMSDNGVEKQRGVDDVDVYVAYCQFLGLVFVADGEVRYGGVPRCWHAPCVGNVRGDREARQVIHDDDLRRMRSIGAWGLEERDSCAGDVRWLGTECRIFESVPVAAVRTEGGVSLSDRPRNGFSHRRVACCEASGVMQ